MKKSLFAIVLFLSLTSCAKMKHKIGDFYKGGYIFKINVWGKGLCMSTHNNPNSQWGCSGTVIEGADGFGIYDGQQNTKDIVAGCTDEVFAAKYCDELESEGFDDWYLPSIEELELMYNQLYVNGLVDNLKDGRYWSSTEDFSYGAWVLNFKTGERENSNSKYNKDLTSRAIRRF
jgi:hypothetical protein